MNDLSSLVEQYQVTSDGTHYRIGTPKAMIDVLERARLNRLHISIDYQHGSETEFGRVGRSLGPALKIPLLISSNRSKYGGEISTRFVREIRDAFGKVLYTTVTDAA